MTRSQRDVFNRVKRDISKTTKMKSSITDTVDFFVNISKEHGVEFLLNAVNAESKKKNVQLQ